MRNAISAVTQFHKKNAKREAQSDDIGHDDGPSHEQDAIDEPERHTRCEAAIHRQGDAAHVFCAEGQNSLRQEAEGGQAGGERANEVCGVHDSCYKLVSILRLFYAG